MWRGHCARPAASMNRYPCSQTYIKVGIYAHNFVQSLLTGKREECALGRHLALSAFENEEFIVIFSFKNA